MLVALVTSLAVLTLEAFVSGIEIRPLVDRFLTEIDFDRALMHGLL